MERKYTHLNFFPLLNQNQWNKFILNIKNGFMAKLYEVSFKFSSPIIGEGIRPINTYLFICICNYMCVYVNTSMEMKTT